jgi:ubiquinone/menaquinone biosynthesis C-methylase UbiE
MLMSKPSNFDVLAGNYDSAFTESRIGKAQRLMSRKWLLQCLTGKTGLQILEINCGTGEDACWLARQGHQVFATDRSAAMIKQAQQKAVYAPHNNHLSFQTCAFDQLIHRFQKEQFDLVFSNFAGLNCVSPADLFVLSSELYALLRPGGYLAAVIFGKRCVWETAYYLGKAKTKQAFRRWSNKKVDVPLATGIDQPVYYYSIKQFATLLLPMQLIKQKPVGLYIPPSYMEAAMQHRPRFFNSLVQLEQRTSRLSVLSPLADHVFLLFKKENQ